MQSQPQSYRQLHLNECLENLRRIFRGRVGPRDEQNFGPHRVAGAVVEGRMYDD